MSRGSSIQKKTLLLLSILFLSAVGVFLYTQSVGAATYTWDGGGGDGLWSTCTNWTSDTCPGSGDIAAFDGGNTSNATIDSLFAGSVLGLDINSGYTGTITQQRSLAIGGSDFIQDDGTFLQGTSTFDMSGDFILNAGSFITGEATSTIENNFTVSPSATYTSSSSRVWVWDNNSTIDHGTFTYPGIFPSVVTMARSIGTPDFTIASGTQVINTGNWSYGGDIFISENALLSVSDSSVNIASLAITGTLLASSTLDINGSFTLNSTGVFEFDGTSMSIENNYTDNGGTFDESGITFVIDGLATNDDTIFTYNGLFPGTIDIAKDQSGDFTVASGTILHDIIDGLDHDGSIIVDENGEIYFGATIIGTGGGIYVGDLTVNGKLSASSTADIDGSLFIGATAEFIYESTTINVERNYTNESSFDETGMTFIIDGNASNDHTIFTYDGIFPGTIDLAKEQNANFTVASGTIIDKVLDASTNRSSVIVEENAALYFGNNALQLGSGVYTSNLTINGIFTSSSSVNIGGSFILGTTGQFIYEGSDFTVQRNYTDNGGTFDASGVIVTFDADATNDDSVFTYPGVFDGRVSINRGTTFNAHDDFTVASGTTILLASNILYGGFIIINGVLDTDGFDIAGNTITVNTGGTLRLDGNETIVTPTLASGSTVDYNGAGTYTALNVGTNYQNIVFSSGTYNPAQDITVAGNFTNSGASFTQTSGTTTFSGTTNILSGNNTFNHLVKDVGSAATLTFAAGDTQTVSGNLVLKGLDAGNRLTLQSSTPSSQWYINPQGTRTIDFVAVSDGNNSNATAINCYDTDCFDGGNNTSFSFEAPPPPESQNRLQGGTRLQGGVRL